MPSHSPMKGSTKYRTRARAMRAGGNHHNHARQKENAASPIPATLLVFRVSIASGVSVVRCVWINELSFDRFIRSLNHLYAITQRIVLNFIHYVVDEENAAA